MAVPCSGKKYLNYIGAVSMLNKEGVYGAACHGIEEFPFSVANTQLGSAQVLTVQCIESKKNA